MSSNKSARQELEKVFGKVCMIEELGIRYIPKDKRRKLKGYTKFDDVLTYHHIREKQFGGEATLENGALIRGYNHRWLHTLEPAQREKINQAIQEYKLAILSSIPTVDKDGTTTFTGGAMTLDFDPSEFLELPLNTSEPKHKKKFNRAKEKREFRRQAELGIDEYERRKNFRKIRTHSAISHENELEAILVSQNKIITPHISTSSDALKMILRSALKRRAEEILSDTTLPDEIRREEFDTIEAYMHYINDFELNQQKLSEYDIWSRYMKDDKSDRDDR